MRSKTVSKDRAPRDRKADRPEKAVWSARGATPLEALETLFGHDPGKAPRPARGTTGIGQVFALVVFVFLLSGPATAGETDDSAEASSQARGVVLDDAGLVKVHGRGAEQPPAVPSSGDTGVILWDEHGQGGQIRHGENRTTGSGNVQGTGLILNRR